MAPIGAGCTAPPDVRAGRLAYVITGLEQGGAETQLLQLAIRLRARGWQVDVVSLIAPGPLAVEFERAGVPVHSTALGRGRWDPRAPLRLASLLRRLRPDVVHSHLVHANILTRAARPLCRVPVLVSTVHSVNEGGRLRGACVRITDPLSDLTTAVSGAVEERYRRARLAPPHKLTVVPNGIDTSRFSPDAEARRHSRAALGLGDRFTWLSVGRLVPAKDYPTLLEAMRSVADARAGAVLLVAGEGPLHDELAERAVRLGLGDQVRLLGRRTDASELMNAADAFVMSSAWEGLPMVLLEAAATGLPIVATDVGGNREVVDDGVSGCLVPAADPRSLAGAMLDTMDAGPAVRRRMGERGRTRVQERFDVERVADRWSELFGGLLRSARREWSA